MSNAIQDHIDEIRHHAIVVSKLLQAPQNAAAEAIRPETVGCIDRITDHEANMLGELQVGPVMELFIGLLVANIEQNDALKNRDSDRNALHKQVRSLHKQLNVQERSLVRLDTRLAMRESELAYLQARVNSLCD